MRIIETKIYTIDELTEKSKELAHEKYINKGINYWFLEDAVTSMEEFCNTFNLNIINYQLGEQSSISWRFSFTYNESVKEFKGIRLMKYVWNNYRSNIYSRKYLSIRPLSANDHYPDIEPEKHPMRKNYLINSGPNKGKWSNSHYSRIQIERSCPFTGICYDGDLLKPIWEFLDNPNDRDFEDLINECFDSFIKSIQNECEYANSMECFIETCHANQYEFDEDGNLI